MLFLVKRVDFDHANKTIELISANPAYELRQCSGNELEDIRVAGRVVVCYHRIWWLGIMDKNDLIA